MIITMRGLLRGFLGSAARTSIEDAVDATLAVWDSPVIRNEQKESKKVSK